jgi:hypothetical protein
MRTLFGLEIQEVCGLMLNSLGIQNILEKLKVNLETGLTGFDF